MNHTDVPDAEFPKRNGLLQRVGCVLPAVLLLWYVTFGPLTGFVNLFLSLPVAALEGDGVEYAQWRFDTEGDEIFGFRIGQSADDARRNLQPSFLPCLSNPCHYLLRETENSFVVTVHRLENYLHCETLSILLDAQGRVRSILYTETGCFPII